MNFIDLKAQQEQILPDGRTLKESIKVNIDKVVEINKDGKIEDTYASLTKPTSKKITRKIESLLD